VKYLVGEDFEVNRFRQALLQSNQRAMRYIALVSAFMAAFTFVQFAVYSLGIFLGKEVLRWNLASQKYQPSDIIGTFFCVVSGGSAFGQISPILKNIAEGKEAFKELMQLVNRKKTLV
jgi:ABC-type multidrug transport system fused ATPase/permease subunit